MAIRKIVSDLEASNNKSNAESLFNYNQQARGVFGRPAERENRINDIDNKYREILVSNFGADKTTAFSDDINGMMSTANRVAKERLDSARQALGGTPATSVVDPSNPNLVVVTAQRAQEQLALLGTLSAQRNKDIEDEKKHSDLMERLLASPWIGAQRAIQTYLDSIADVASQTETLVGNALKGLEDKLVDFVQTGKFNFRDLAQSILADLTRMFVKNSIMKPITEFLQKKTGLFGKAPKEETSDYFKSMVVTAATVIVNGNQLGGVSSVTDALGAFGSNSKIPTTNYPTLDPLSSFMEDPAKTQAIMDQMLNPLKTIMSSFTGGFGGIINSVMSVFQSIIGSMGGGAGGGASGIMSLVKLGASFFGVPVLHQGGLASNPKEFRNVDMSSVMGLPKYHSGKLGSNELFAILKNDEIVLNKDQQGRLGQRMSSKGGNNLAIPTQINLTYNAAEGGSDTKEAENMSKMLSEAVDRQVRTILLKEKMQGGMLR